VETTYIYNLLFFNSQSPNYREKECGLIETKTRKGIRLTPKGIKFLKMGYENKWCNSEEMLHHKTIGEEKLHYFTIKNSPPQKKIHEDFRQLPMDEKEIVEYSFEERWRGGTGFVVFF